MKGRKDLVGPDSEVYLADGVGVALLTGFGSSGQHVEHFKSRRLPEELDCPIKHTLAGAHDA